jgi:quinohemoprotein ethanol dehydrogenase
MAQNRLLPRRRGLRLLVGLTALTVAVVGVTGVGQGASNKTEAIAPAPAFTAADVAKLPTDNWITNGGSTMNQRYSPLTQINVDNVSKLKGVWMTHLRGRALAAKYSGESQPIVYKGTMYVTSGDDDVFAVSVKTGKILWEKRGKLDQKITTVCCGWLNRGVALGDGMLYYNRLDGWTEALDQGTGKVVWRKHIVRWQRGQTMTQAPLYMDGKIYVGVVGAEFGTRSFLQAMDAKTGKMVWRWYSIPGPKDPGGDTWPKGSSEYLRGGASVWSTPSVDTKLGLMYISTGNAGSDWFGGDRAGKNLYACSIVALDIKTGKVKWYFQEVHHDIWDYDAPSPVVLFDTKANGKTVAGLGQPGKTGWLYLLDRATGKPLYGIDEKPVPQNAQQKTWPTQPIPRNGEFIPHTPPPANEVARVKKERDKNAKKVPLVVAEKPFTPPTTKSMLVYSPGPQGGNNWEPSSYNQKTNMFYVCAANQTVGVLSAHSTFKAGQSYTGVGAISGIGFNESPGTFTAIDAGSGKVVWQKKWPAACYSGTTTTAGNLVFVGRQTGELQARLELPDRCWRERHARDLPAGRQAVPRLPGGRQLAHGDAARRQPLAARPRRQDGPGQGTRRRQGHAARRRGRRQQEGRERRQEGNAQQGRRRGRQDRLHGELRHLPRSLRQGRQRRPRPDADRGGAERGARHLPGHERRRRDAALQGPADPQADP